MHFRAFGAHENCDTTTDDNWPGPDQFHAARGAVSTRGDHGFMATLVSIARDKGVPLSTFVIWAVALVAAAIVGSGGW